MSFVVSPTGKALAAGSQDDPWDLATALRNPATVPPGETVWMRGGTYRGDFVSRLTGSVERPVTLRALPGERATLDGRFDIEGSHALYGWFEIMYSDTKRVTTMFGSDPADLSRERKTVFVTGPHNRLVHLDIHDLGDGLFSGSSAEGLEIYGCLVHNNGWEGPDRGHGHGMYLQNSGAIKRVEDNCIYNSYSTGLKIAGSAAAMLINFRVLGNTIFGSGAPVLKRYGYTYNLHQEGGAGRLGNTVYERNSLYQENGNIEAFRLNAAGDPPGFDVSLVRNIVQGRPVFNEMTNYTDEENMYTSGRALLSGQNTLRSMRMLAGQPFSAHSVRRNRYAAPASPKLPFYLVQLPGGGQLLTFAQWQSLTGYDVDGSYTVGRFTGVDIVVRPSRYEKGRALITVWNWDEAPSVDVDVSGILRLGDQYELHHVHDVWGEPVRRGVYVGMPLSIPMIGLPASPKPIGFSDTIPSLRPEFGAFVLRRINQQDVTMPTLTISAKPNPERERQAALEAKSKDPKDLSPKELSDRVKVLEDTVAKLLKRIG